MPKLTVLMPVFNAERFLAEAIDSILAQTLSDFEFLIIDDGSTDGTAAMVASYTDPRIRFYQNEKNMGISPTLNRGIELASTPYIARMDADDISYPERLEKQYAYLQAHSECAMVSSLVRVVTEDGLFVRQDKFRSEFFYYNLIFICWIYHPTVLYRKQAVLEIGMYTAAYAEDYELFWQLSRRHVLYNLPEVLLDYRTTSQSLHQVLRKEEYAEAQLAQMLRNVRYYTGNGHTVPSDFLESYQHNFEPLLTSGSVTRVLACIRELDHITQCVLASENVNHDNASIRKAARYKRNFILAYYIQRLPPFKGGLLSVRSGYAVQVLKAKVKKLFKKPALSV
ncbi:glycosyltransferase [Pontibacter sp. E15-1]|uniref:glycosyltransferase family 2 protein n=1 Tax=Pontibacter sp. E15-1 TaxID=2919918 RepID=UPI001F4F1D6D|nr:glycosyltransferase [Pontibacter sp. E15-1]MCJ8165335.1 glycosyltransferase [Pontibacter sp. E15-1]